MPLLSDVIRARLVLDNLPEGFCFESFMDLLKALPGFLSVEIPSSITNVIVSNVQPLSNQSNAVWFRVSNSGVFMGIYIFSGGSWIQIFPQVNGVFWFYGDSRSPQAGYAVIDSSNTAMVAAIGAGAVTAMEATYIFDPTNTYWVVFACNFVGF